MNSMKLWSLYAATLMSVVTVGCGGGEGQLFEKTIPAPSLRGNSIGEPVEQRIAVYVPPGYASDGGRYPAVYIIPGYDSPDGALLDGTFQGFSLAAAVDRLVAESAIEKMIVVVVNGRSALGEAFYTHSPAAGNWDRFLVRDVIRYVDEQFKTLPFRETRGIAGYATGATGALQVAMRYPEYFSAVYATSPGLIGDIDDELRAYEDSEPKLEAVIVEIGSGGTDASTVEAHQYLVDRLNEAGPSRLIRFDGGYEDKLRQRIEEEMLPFFSRVLVLE
jgi:enterochelin esterase-like enzyme